MIITETNWRKLYEEAEGQTLKEANYDLMHAILWIAEHGEWGEYDEEAIKATAEKADRLMHDLTHGEDGNVRFGGGTFRIN